MPCDFQSLPHPGIRTLAPYIPGKSTEALARERGLDNIIKLASNENPLGCSSLVKAALERLSVQQIASYPSPLNHPLISRLAGHLGVEESMIALGNGTDMLFPLLMICFALHRDKQILIHDYAFIAYRIHAKTLGIPVITTPLNAHWQVEVERMIQACQDRRTALIFLANPNNPVGTILSCSEIEHLLQHIPETTILVLDEAYFEYNEPFYRGNMIQLLKQYRNLVITRTFSKAYGLAGLRLGYAIAHPEIISILLRAQPPFSLNQAALFAGVAALQDTQFIQETVALNQQGLKQLKKGLSRLGLRCLPTSGNFVTVAFPSDIRELDTCLQKHGIIVRPLNPYGLDHYLRISVGTPQQNERFLETLEICLNRLELEYEK